MGSKIQQNLSRELSSLQSNSEPGWVAESYYPNDLRKWRLYLNGPCGSPYENGEFQLSLTFPSAYPIQPPELRFDTKIFHPNVDFNGTISLHSCCVSGAYAPSLTIRYLLQDLMLVIRNPNPDYFVNDSAAFLFDRDRKLFQEQAAKWTIEYAADAEIMSAQSYSPSPSGIITPETCSPNSLRARSPDSHLWMFQQISDSVGAPVEQWCGYPKSEQRELERAYRSHVSLIELNNKLIIFSYGIQICEDGNSCHVKRNIPKTKRLRQRHKCLAFYNVQYSVEDPIIESCLASSVNTNISIVIAGILHEGSLNNQTEKAEELVQDLKKMNETDIVLIGLECIHLYTRDSFLSKALNKFLRERDYSKIATLGPFCKILYLQFAKYRSDIESLKVYRGQQLRAHDLRAYKRATGKGSYKCLGFTSTTKNQKLAQIFIQNALFIIRLEKRYNDGRAFDIAMLSQFSQEEEILLRPGVEFSIDRFEYNEPSKKYTFYLVAYI